MNFATMQSLATRRRFRVRPRRLRPALLGLVPILVLFATPRPAAAQVVDVVPIEEADANASDDEGFTNPLSDLPAMAPPPLPTGETTPGQSDLDRAIEKRLEADTPEELAEIESLIESAIAKGLNEQTQTLAGTILAAVRLERAQGMMQSLVRSEGPAAMRMRGEILSLLEEANRSDPNLTEAYLLRARLRAMAGEVDQARQLTTDAVERLADDPAGRAKALVMRAMTQTTDDARLTDLNAATQSDPSNLDARRTRAALRLKRGDVEGAIEDMEVVLIAEPSNRMIAAEVVGKLAETGQVDRAIGLLDRMLAKEKSEGVYRLRALLHQQSGNLDQAKADLDAALQMQPTDPLALLQRSELRLNNRDVAGAKADLDAALELEPRLATQTRPLALKAQIAIVENRVSDAISIIREISERNPQESFWKMRLATLYTIDQRPRQAIEVLSEALEIDPDSVELLRNRGDSWLAVGEHGKAVEDYETALRRLGNYDKVDPDEALSEEASGLLNNLAWVLSTSPEDDVRDGEKALRYGEKAAEMTQYERPHILSTLAAAHAEQGDFEEARKWSGKAVELATEEDHEQLEQLKEELESYEKDEPWREKQETEENAVPILDPEDLIET